MHGFVVTRFLFLDLALESLCLVFRVVKLGETIGNFTSSQKEFKTIGYKRIIIIGARQWRDFSWIRSYESRLQQLIFDRFFEDFDLQLATAEIILNPDANIIRIGLEVVAVANFFDIKVRIVLRDCLFNGQTLKRLREIRREWEEGKPDGGGLLLS